MHGQQQQTPPRAEEGWRGVGGERAEEVPLPNHSSCETTRRRAVQSLPALLLQHFKVTLR